MACAKDLEEDLSHAEAHQMIKLGDPNEIGGVDEIGFVNLMKELGLWGKNKGEEKEQEGFLK